mgnify:CR=1 FL=1
MSRGYAIIARQVSRFRQQTVYVIIDDIIAELSRPKHEVLREIDERLIDKFARVTLGKMPTPSQSTFASA